MGFSNYDPEHAIARIERGRAWREDLELETLTPEDIKVEIDMKVLNYIGKDKEGRPVVLVLPRNI